jgi:MoxR-like ATPase
MTLYSGAKLTKSVRLVDGETLPPYLPDADLIQAVNLAIVLQRPLLVMGEPGCGKSVLATAVAYELYHDQKLADIDKGAPQDFKNWLFKWHIKSTTKAKDGFYEYEALRRLLDVQLASKTGSKKADDVGEYVKKRKMAEAIEKSTPLYPAILLIDEIDKADLDFPNDLLNELEGGDFIVPETNKPIVERGSGDNKKRSPLIIITSNREKELPDAFLRRCIYYYIPPFSADRLKLILENRFYKKDTSNEDAKALIDSTVIAFEEIRKDIRANKVSGKNVSTSELIDWFDALKRMAEMSKTDDVIKKEIADIKDFLANKVKNLPLQQALFKNFETSEMFK